MARIYIKTLGCSANVADSEAMAGMLEKAGFEIVRDEAAADLIIVNVCTVKGEGAALRAVKELRSDNSKIVIAGCITPALYRELRALLPDASFVSTHNITKIVGIVEECMHGNASILLAPLREAKICLPRKRVNPVVGIIPIASGCNSSCAYCSVKQIKGDILSYPVDAIKKEMRRALAEGCKEIWITSQDNAAYGTDNSEISKLPELLVKLARIPGDFRIRVGMMNPRNVLPVLDELIQAFKSDKVFKFLHLPLQSGSDRILKAMNRGYSINDFIRIIDAFRKDIPEITIATDIICGFPGEDDACWNQTIEAIKRISPDIVNISRYRKRAGTKAAKMKPVPGEVQKERSRILTSLAKNIARMRNERWLGWKGSIIVDEHGKEGCAGRNFAYKQVILRKRYALGEVVDVRIKTVTPFYLVGEPLYEVEVLDAY